MFLYLQFNEIELELIGIVYNITLTFFSFYVDQESGNEVNLKRGELSSVAGWVVSLRPKSRALWCPFGPTSMS